MIFHRRYLGSDFFVTFGGSGGIMTTARPELPYPCSSQAKAREESSRRGGGSLTVCYKQICKFQTNYSTASGAFIAQ